jgi:hypothetical protein
MKPGYKTTEFLTIQATALGQLIAALTSQLSPHWAAIGISVSEGLYAISRGLAKVPTPIVPPVPPTTKAPSA